MASKRFRGFTCVYCAVRPSSTGDHVLAREFVPLGKRDNLPKVPACSRCNNEKAALEHYLTAMLPFGAQHGDALPNLTTMVPPRLRKNAKLSRELAARGERVWVRSSGGVLLPSMTLPFDGERLARLAGLIARGLAWHHWQLLLPPDADVVSACLTEAGVQGFGALLAGKARNRIQGDIADGALQYYGVQGDDSSFTIWLMKLMGGIMFTGDPSSPNDVTTLIGALTGPKQMNVGAMLSLPGKKPAA